MDALAFLELMTASIPPTDVYAAEYDGPLPAPADERFRAVCAAYRDLAPVARCEAVSRLTAHHRDWLISWPFRTLMLSVRQRFRAHLEDALLGIYLSYPAPGAERLAWSGYLGGLATAWRCAQLLGLGGAVFESQLPYACQSAVTESVRRFLNYEPQYQRLEHWGFREETGDHGIIFCWGRLAIPEGWL